MTTKALLCVSFGTSVASTREKTLDVIEADLQQRFPDRAFYRAWTSGVIAKKVRAQGVVRETLDEAFGRMSADGVDDVLVAVTCLMHGGEMCKTEAALSGWLEQDPARSARMATALLETPADCQIMADAVMGEFADMPSEDALLLMGHGSSSGPNEVYNLIQDALQQMRPLCFVSTVEGVPAFEDTLEQVVASGARCVHVAPLMVVAGEHALADMAGEGDGSWVNRLRSRGMRAKAVLRGLGEYESVRNIICQHARDARPCR